MTAEKEETSLPPEFKKEAVALVTTQGYSIAKAAQSVNASEQNLRRSLEKLYLKGFNS